MSIRAANTAVAALLAAVLLAAAGCNDFASRETEGERVLREYEEYQKEQEKAAAPAPGDSVMVVVERIVLGAKDRSNVDLAWRYADESVTAGSCESARRNGIRVGIGTDRFRAELQAALQKSSAKEVQQARLRAVSGRTATFAVAQDVYVDSLRYRTAGGERVLLEKATIGTSLIVQPLILPDHRVRLRLYPRVASLTGQTVDLTEAAVDVELDDGQTMALGGLDQAAGSAGWALFSWGSSSESRRMTLLVTPHIEGRPQQIRRP